MSEEYTFVKFFVQCFLRQDAASFLIQRASDVILRSFNGEEGAVMPVFLLTTLSNIEGGV